MWKAVAVMVSLLSLAYITHAQCAEQDAECAVRAFLSTSADSVEGWDVKRSAPMGDKAAVAFIKVIGDRTLSEGDIKRGLTLLRIAFSSPSGVQAAQDREPNTTLFLLNYFAALARDEVLAGDISTARGEILANCSRASSPPSIGSGPRTAPKQVEGATSLSLAQVQKAASPPSFSLGLTAVKPEFALDSQIKLIVHLANTSDRTIFVRRDKDPNGAEFDFDISVRDANGHEIAKTERYRAVKGDPTSTAVVVDSGGMVQLSPGDEIATGMVLNTLFELNLPGTYSVQVQRQDKQTGSWATSNALKITLTW